MLAVAVVFVAVAAMRSSCGDAVSRQSVRTVVVTSSVTSVTTVVIQAPMPLCVVEGVEQAQAPDGALDEETSAASAQALGGTDRAAGYSDRGCSGGHGAAGISARVRAESFGVAAADNAFAGGPGVWVGAETMSVSRETVTFRRCYPGQRPHSALGRKAPAVFTAA